MNTTHRLHGLALAVLTTVMLLGAVHGLAASDAAGARYVQAQPVTAQA